MRLKLLLTSARVWQRPRGMASMTSKGTLAPASILAESWSIAAEGYDEIFVPRFKPWTDNALALLGSTEFKLPQGDVLVPTCGPGHELPLVAELLKNRNVRGTDLAPGATRRRWRRGKPSVTLSPPHRHDRRRAKTLRRESETFVRRRRRDGALGRIRGSVQCFRTATTP